MVQLLQGKFMRVFISVGSLEYLEDDYIRNITVV